MKSEHTLDWLHHLLVIFRRMHWTMQKMIRYKLLQFYVARSDITTSKDNNLFDKSSNERKRRYSNKTKQKLTFAGAFFFVLLLKIFENISSMKWINCQNKNKYQKKLCCFPIKWADMTEKEKKTTNQKYTCLVLTTLKYKI